MNLLNVALVALVGSVITLAIGAAWSDAKQRLARRRRRKWRKRNPPTVLWTR